MTLQEFLSNTDITQYNYNPSTDGDRVFPQLDISVAPSIEESDVEKKCLIAIVNQNNQLLMFLNSVAGINVATLCENLGGVRRAANVAALLMTQKLEEGTGEGLGLIHVHGDTGGAYANLFMAEPDDGGATPPEEPDIPTMVTGIMTYLSQWSAWLTDAISTYQSNLAHAEDEGTRFVPALIAAAPVLTPALVATACAAVPMVGAVLVGTNIISGIVKAGLEREQINMFEVFIKLFRRSMFATSGGERKGLADILALLQANTVVTIDGKSVNLAELLRLLMASFRRPPVDTVGEAADDSDNKVSIPRLIEQWTKYLAAQDGTVECPLMGWCVSQRGEPSY